MKSLVRLSATLGLVGSVVLGALPGLETLRALALPEQQVLEKLGAVPVFTITDPQGSPLVASVNEGQKKTAVAGVFISQQDAQTFIERLKKQNPQLASTVKVVPVSLGDVYKLDQANASKPDGLDFAFVPVQQQVDSAKAILSQSGKPVQNFDGVPLFVARGGKDKGYLTLQRDNKPIIPFFFSKEELQSMLDRFKQQQPALASTVEIQVVNLEGVIETLRTSNNQQLNSIVLVPPKASVDFVRSRGPAPANSQQQRPQQRPQQRR
jgi:nickel transport protein